MFNWIWRVLAGPRPLAEPTQSLQSGPESLDPRIEPALELEKRLYESALAGVDQAFAKEGIVGTFLTSGAIVAFVYSLQTLAALAPFVGRRALFTSIALIVCAFGLLLVSGIKFALLLRGWNVKDVSDGLGFMNKGAIASTRQDALLKLIQEYRRARKRHEILIKRRLASLFRALAWLAISIAVSFASVMIAFLSLAVHKKPLSNPEILQRHPEPMLISTPQAYNIDMASNPNPKPPIKLPQPGPGTIMIKGGGGSGARK